MKESKEIKIRAIEEKTAAEYERAVNEALNEITKVSKKYDYQQNTAVAWGAIITYEIVTKIPENSEDEARLKGHRGYYCFECPYFEPSIDRRVKHGECQFANYERHKGQPACKLFYEKLLRGELTPIE